MFRVLKQPSQRDSSFEHSKHMLKLMGKKILLTILHSQFLFILKGTATLMITMFYMKDLNKP